ncbi:MAG: 30S ribosomal protein S6 [Candidatus Chisholmbacteria bacterium]|nr:30S ribosomal protein S6 [Candidatus Chisholmbacteria bacterium]
MNGTYELTVVYPADLGETKNKKALQALEGLVEKSKGRIIEKRDFGRKPLAYPIKKATEGYYAHWLVELPTTGPQALTKAFSMDEKVLRYLVVKPYGKVIDIPKKKVIKKKIITKKIS